MASLNEETKNIISGILTASPVLYNISRLSKDFVDLVGYEIPYRQLGYSNIEHYLNSIPDTVKLRGSGPDAKVILVVKKDTAHIKHLVDKQRRKRHKRKDTPRRHYRVPQSSSFRRRPEPSHFQSSACSQPPPRNFISDSDSSDYEKEKIPETNHTISTPSNNKLNNVIETNDVKKKNCLTLEAGLLENLKMIISEYPEGITVDDFILKYRKRFKSEIPFYIYNCWSLPQLFAELPEIFKIVKLPSSDYMIFDANRPVNVDILAYEKMNDKYDYDDEDQDLNDSSCENELSGIKINWKLSPSDIPPNVLHFGDIIYRHFIDENVKEGDLLDIEVAEIYDLSKFYVYETNGGLKELMKEIQFFYNFKRNRIHIPEAFQQEGVYCITQFFDEYHRAIIVNLLPIKDKEVRVLFIDYGTVGNVPCNEIFYMNTAFGTLPCQCMRARLSNIYPPIENTQWTIEAKSRFSELLKGRKICAEVIKIDWKEKILELYLADITDVDNIFYINEVLVNEGHAIYTEQKQSPANYGSATPTVKYIHFYPTFLEIESGLVPNSEEFCKIINENITVDHYNFEYFLNEIEEDFSEFDKDYENHLNKPPLTIAIDNINGNDELDFDFFGDGNIKNKIKEIAEENNQSISDTSKSIINNNEKDKSESELDSKSISDTSKSIIINNEKNKSESELNSNVNRSGSCNRKQRLSSLMNSSKNSNIILNNEQENIQKDDINNKIIPTLNDLNLRSSDTVKNNNIPKKSTNPFLNCDITYEEPIKINPSNPFLYPLDNENNTIKESDVLELFTKKNTNIQNTNLASNFDDDNDKFTNTKTEITSLLDKTGTTKIETINNENNLNKIKPKVTPPPGFESHNPPPNPHPHFEYMQRFPLPSMGYPSMPPPPPGSFPHPPLLNQLVTTNANQRADYVNINVFNIYGYPPWLSRPF